VIVEFTIFKFFCINFFHAGMACKISKKFNYLLAESVVYSRHRYMIPFRCVAFISGVDAVLRTSILPAMVARLYNFSSNIRHLIQLSRRVLQEPQGEIR